MEENKTMDLLVLNSSNSSNTIKISFLLTVPETRGRDKDRGVMG
jgi:hypothetical protein